MTDENESGKTAVEAKLESEVTDENTFLVSMLGLSSGSVNGEDVDVSFTGQYVKVKIGDRDDRVVFDMDEVVAAAYDRLEAENEVQPCP